MGDDVNFLEQVVESDQRVGEKENRFGHANDILGRRLGPALGLKVVNTVIRDVADHAA